MIAPLLMGLGGLIATLTWAKNSKITGTSHALPPGAPGSTTIVPNVFAPPAPDASPDTPLLQANAPLISAMTDWLNAHTTPAEQEIVKQHFLAMSAAKPGAVTINDFCGVLNGVIDQGRMAEMVKQFPQLSACPTAVPPAGPNAAPAVHPVAPSITPGTPAPPPTTPVAVKPGVPQGPAAVVTQPVHTTYQPASDTNTPIPMAMGVNLVLAAQLAPILEANIKAKKYDYDRMLCTRFQIAAGLKGDGIYAGRTQGALSYFLHRVAPKALFEPLLLQSYVPPQGAALPTAAQIQAPLPQHAGYDVNLAKALAPQVEADLIKNKAKYDRLLMTRFQVAAGVKGDGQYGGYSQGALSYFLGHLAPKALVAPLTMKPYNGPTYNTPSLTPMKPAVSTTPVATAVPNAAPATLPAAPPKTPAPNPSVAAPVAANLGMDLVLAAQLAPLCEYSLVHMGAKYDKPLLTRFQIAAGLSGDGKYGGYTAGTLAYFLGRPAPGPLVSPLTVTHYAPPVGVPLPTAAQVAGPIPPHAGYNPSLAQQMAAAVATNITQKKAAYDRYFITRFQVAAGLLGDGEYGGRSAGALGYFLGATPPKPLVTPLLVQPYNGPTYNTPTMPGVPATSISSTTPVQPKPAVQATALTATQAATLLRDYLIKTSDFGSKAAPSSTVKTYQAPLGVTPDGIVGDKTRAAAAKQGIVLPVPGAPAVATTAAPTEADLLKSRPSALLAVRSTEAPTVPGAVAGADLQLSPLTDAQKLDFVTRMKAWSSKINVMDEVRLYKAMIDLAKEKNVTLSMPLSYDQLTQVFHDPQVACALLQKSLPQPYITTLLKIPTMAAKWALFCAQKLVMPGGFPKGLWDSATEAERKQIVLNWYPGVKVVAPSKPVVATQTPATAMPGQGYGAQLEGYYQAFLRGTPPPPYLLADFTARRDCEAHGGKLVPGPGANSTSQNYMCQLPDGRQVSPASLRALVFIVPPALGQRMDDWAKVHLSTAEITKMQQLRGTTPQNQVTNKMLCDWSILAMSKPNFLAFAQAFPEVACAIPVTAPVAHPATPAAVVTHPAVAPAAAPTGYNPTLARTLARQVVTDVRSKSYNYSRQLVGQFQQAAGIKADGIYGGQTVGALKFYGADRAPKALFSPTAEVPYTPPA